MKIDLKKINGLIDQKYINVQKHPNLDLYIYNYTQKCQFERFWTEETTMCRGLITDSEGNIVARPFKKFFNLAEHTGEDSKLPAVPIEDFEVFDKLDGSLGILYWGENGGVCLATRGSFVSEQAFKGSEILDDIYSDHPGLVFDTNCTYLFEIIYPQNRIVVDYGGIEDLYLLAVIRTETGEEMPYQTMVDLYKDKLRIVERFDGLTDLEEIQKMAKDNSEGFVIRYKNGMRVKVKFDEYVRLHRLVTGVNAKRIWEHLKNKESLDELLDRVPDEFYQWVTDTVGKLQHAFNDIELACFKKLDEVQNLTTRKEQALALQSFEYRGVVFTMLDHKDYSEAIWKLCKPTADKPWKEDIDA